MLHARMLRYLDEVARSGSIRRAATRLNVASSAINRQILALEQALGTPIFDRLPRKLVLTAAGEILISHVRQTLRAMDQVATQIEELKGLRRGEVSVALMSGLAANMIPTAMVEFRRTYPRVRLILRQLPTGDEILAAVASGASDLGLGFDFRADPALRTLGSVTCRLGAVVAPHHKLAERQMVRLSDCIGMPMVLADPSTAIRPHLDAAFARLSVVIEPVVETNSIEVMRHAAMLDQGLTFLTPFDIEVERRLGQLVYVPIHDPHLRPQTLMLVARDRGLDSIASVLAELLSRVMQEPR